MTHYVLLTNPEKCQGKVAGCHPQKADCRNSVGGFECKCKNYQYGYGDGYDQGSAERDGTRTRAGMRTSEDVKYQELYGRRHPTEP